MNVAVICPNDYSTVLFCKGILLELKSNKDIQTVYVISDTYGEDTNGYYIKVLESWGVKHIHLKINRFMSPVADLFYLYGLYKIVRHEDIGAVVNISTKPNVYGTFAARLAGAQKVLCSVWGRGRVFAHQDNIQSILLRFVLLGMYRLAFGLSTKVWFTNKNDCEYFIDHRIVTRERVILTKNYVNTDDYCPLILAEDKLLMLKTELGLRSNDKVVIMVGRMIWTKGVGEFIEAAKLLKSSLPDVKFVLVGPEEKGSPDSIPPEYLEKNRKSENFIWVGFRKDVKDLYAISEIAVLPSYYREGGYPRALTEPMAMGKPVIAADTVDCRSPVEHGRNGYLVPIKDPISLANAIETLLKDDIKRKEFGAYSRIKAKSEYDEKSIVKLVIETFLI